MKRSKRLYTLLGALCVISVITIAVSKYEENKEKIKNSDEIILEVESDTVTSLSWEYESTSLSFHKDETWVYDEDEAFPVDEEKINELIEVFASFGASFTIEEAEDYGQYGLDEPVCTISMTTEEKEYEISLGDYSAMDSERYVSIGDGNVYLVTNDPLESFDKELRDMILHDEIPTFDKVTSVQFEGTENYEFIYEEESNATYCEDDVYFVKEGEELFPLDTELVNSYLDNISYLSTTDYVTYNATEEELKTYGLDEPELSVTVEYVTVNEDNTEETNTFVLHISQNPEERENAAEDSEEDITAYMRVGESKIIYKITGDSYDTVIDCSRDSLRHREVLSAAFSDILQLDISLEGNEYTIKAEEKDGEVIYYYNEKEIEINDLKSSIVSLKADSFVENEPTEKEEICLKVYLDNEKYPEVNIELYRYDGSYCLAVVDGEPIALVDRTLVVDVIEAVNAIVLNE